MLHGGLRTRIAPNHSGHDTLIGFGRRLQVFSGPDGHTEHGMNGIMMTSTGVLRLSTLEIPYNEATADKRVPASRVLQQFGIAKRMTGKPGEGQLMITVNGVELVNDTYFMATNEETVARWLDAQAPYRRALGLNPIEAQTVGIPLHTEIVDPRIEERLQVLSGATLRFSGILPIR